MYIAIYTTSTHNLNHKYSIIILYYKVYYPQTKRESTIMCVHSNTVPNSYAVSIATDVFSEDVFSEKRN